MTESDYPVTAEHVEVAFDWLDTQSSLDALDTADWAKGHRTEHFDPEDLGAQRGGISRAAGVDESAQRALGERRQRYKQSTPRERHEASLMNGATIRGFLAGVPPTAAAPLSA